MVILEDNPVAHLSEYELRYLAVHLAEAERLDALHRLLSLETSAGRNAWYAAKEANDDTAGYLADVTRAWQVVEQVNAKAANSGKVMSYLGDEILYALCFVSVNSLASNLSPNLLLSLISKHIWNSTQCLAYSYRLVDASDRAAAIAGIVEYLPSGPQRNKALKDALLAAREKPPKIEAGAAGADERRATQLEHQRLETLARLAFHVSEPQRSDLFEEAVNTARTTDVWSVWKRKSIRERSRALSRVASYLPVSLKDSTLEEALNTALEDPDPSLLAEIASYLPPPKKAQVLAKALAAAYEEYSDSEPESDGTSEELVKIASYLPQPQKSKVLAEALSRDTQRRNARKTAKGYGSSADELSTGEISFNWVVSLLEANLQEALVAVRMIEDKGWRSRALIRLALCSSEPQKNEMLAEALSAARSIEPSSWRAPQLRAKVLCEIGSHLPYPDNIEIWVEALSATRAPDRYWNIVDRAEMLAEIIPHLPEPIPQPIEGELKNVLSSLMVINDETVRAEVTSDLGWYTLKPEYKVVSSVTLKDEMETDDQLFRMKTLTWLAQNLPESVINKIPADVLAETLAKWTPCLPEADQGPVLAKTLAVARSTVDIKSHWRSEERAETLVKVASYLPESRRGEILADALVATREVDSLLSRTRALVEIASYLPEPQRNNVLTDALAKVRGGKAAVEIADENVLSAWLDLLIKLANSVEGERALYAKKAIEATQSFWSQSERILFLNALARYLPEQDKYYILKETLQKTLAEFEDYKGKIDESGGGAAYLGHGFLASAEQSRNTLTYLISRLPGALHKEALEAAWIINHSEPLLKLAPNLAESLLAEALMQVLMLKTSDDVRQSEMLAGLVLQLVNLPSPTLYTIWRKAVHLMVNQTRHRYLSDIRLLIIIIFALGGEKPILETVNSIQKVGHWWP